MAGRGLLLDFGGVMTSSPYQRMAEFCAESRLFGLPELADGAGRG